MRDDFRGGSFEEYSEFHELIVKTYERLGYYLIPVPLEPLELRAKFVIENVKALNWQRKSSPTLHPNRSES